MPLSDRILSATPSDALEQLVPMTPRSAGRPRASWRPVCPPSAEQPSSSFTSVTAWSSELAVDGVELPVQIVDARAAPRTGCPGRGSSWPRDREQRADLRSGRRPRPSTQPTVGRAAAAGPVAAPWSPAGVLTSRARRPYDGEYAHEREHREQRTSASWSPPPLPSRAGRDRWYHSERSLRHHPEGPLRRGIRARGSPGDAGTGMPQGVRRYGGDRAPGTPRRGRGGLEVAVDQSSPSGRCPRSTPSANAHASAACSGVAIPRRPGAAGR